VCCLLLAASAVAAAAILCKEISFLVFFSFFLFELTKKAQYTIIISNVVRWIYTDVFVF